jgi:hypothetical protein
MPTFSGLPMPFVSSPVWHVGQQVTRPASSRRALRMIPCNINPLFLQVRVGGIAGRDVLRTLGECDAASIRVLHRIG